MSTKIWLQGIVAAFVSAFSTAASGAIALPTVFNFSHDGMINMLKLAIVPAMVAVFTYLQKSPLPGNVIGPGDKATVQNPVISADGSMTGTSATLIKAVEAVVTSPKDLSTK